MKKGNLKIIFFYVLIIGLIIFALAMLFNQPKDPLPGGKDKAPNGQTEKFNSGYREKKPAPPGLPR